MKIEWKTCFKIGVSIFILYLCINYSPIAVNFIKTIFKAAAPLFLGGVIAYPVNILMSLYERHYFPNSTNLYVRKSKRPVCMIAAFITLLAILVLIICLIFPQLASCVRLIFASLPNVINSIIANLDKINVIPEDIATTLSAIDWQSKIGQIANMLTSGVGNVMDFVISTVSSVFSGVMTTFISFIFSIYVLSGKEKLLKQFDCIISHYLPKRWYEKVIYVLSVFHDCFRRYIIGQCTEAVILGLLCATGMFILKLPYAAMIGTLIAFTALIPVAGAYIGAAVGALMIFPVSPIKALIFIIYLSALQQFEGNIIYPRVVGSSMGLPGIWVLAAVTVGGGIMGILGILLSVPVAASLYRLLKNDINKRDSLALQRTSE